jgi:hypothetical protein
MYNVELVRELAREICNEQDPQKARDLLTFLQAVIKEDVEEIRVRALFLSNRYPINDSDSQTAA